MAQDPNLPINERGRVRVWQIEDKKWLNLHPVDAREQLIRGIGSLEEGSAAAPEGLVASAHLEDMTVNELGEYVEANKIDVDLAEHRLKADKVAAIKAALAAREQPEGEPQPANAAAVPPEAAE